jgi:hypothetical protein
MAPARGDVGVVQSLPADLLANASATSLGKSFRSTWVMP